MKAFFVLIMVAISLPAFAERTIEREEEEHFRISCPNGNLPALVKTDYKVVHEMVYEMENGRLVPGSVKTGWVLKTQNCSTRGTCALMAGAAYRSVSVTSSDTGVVVVEMRGSQFSDSFDPTVVNPLIELGVDKVIVVNQRTKEYEVRDYVRFLDSRSNLVSIEKISNSNSCKVTQIRAY